MPRTARIARQVPAKRTPSERAKRSVPGHLKWIRTLPCAVRGGGGCSGKVEAAHVRKGTDGGTGLKPHDRWSVPLCADHHRWQHTAGEDFFWSWYGIDPVQLAERLWRVSGDTEQGLRAIERARQAARLKEGSSDG